MLQGSDNVICSRLISKENLATICNAYGVDTLDLKAQLMILRKDDHIENDDIPTVIAPYKNLIKNSHKRCN